MKPERKISEVLIFARLFNYFMTEAVICFANQWTGFYMITAPVMNELKFTKFGNTEKLTYLK